MVERVAAIEAGQQRNALALHLAFERQYPADISNEKDAMMLQLMDAHRGEGPCGR